MAAMGRRDTAVHKTTQTDIAARLHQIRGGSGGVHTHTHTKKSKVARAYDGFARLEVESVCQHARESREEKKKSYLAITARALPLRAPHCVGTKSDGEQDGEGGIRDRWPAQ